MLSLIALVSVVCLAQAAVFHGPGHSPFLHGTQTVTGYSRHGDHVDAHVNTHVSDGFGGLHIKRDHVPVTGGNVGIGGIGGIGGMGGYGGYGGYNNFIGGGYPYNNFNNMPYNNFYGGGRMYRPWGRGSFHQGGHLGGHNHIHRTKRAALVPMARYPLDHQDTSNQVASKLGANFVDSRFGGRNSPNGDNRRYQLPTNGDLGAKIGVGVAVDTGNPNIANRMWNQLPRATPHRFGPLAPGYKQIQNTIGLSKSKDVVQEFTDSDQRSFSSRFRIKDMATIRNGSFNSRFQQNNMAATQTGSRRQRTMIRRKTTYNPSSGSIWLFRHSRRYQPGTRHSCSTRNCIQRHRYRLFTTNPFYNIRQVPLSYFSRFGF